MCKAMGRPLLFKTNLGAYGEKRPTKFAFLLRPTLDEYNAFVLQLDKLLSDNMSPKFFSEDMALEEEVRRDDGKIEVRRKGTIQLLDEWIRSQFKTSNDGFWTEWNDAMSHVKAIRKERQKPAHVIENDKFDYELIPRQRELIKNAYMAVRLLRMALENHPAVRTDENIEVPDALRMGKIWIQ